MDKLGQVKEATAQKDKSWEEWGLVELVENLRKYTDKNPLPDATAPTQQETEKPVGNQGNNLRRKESMLMSSPSLRQPRQLPTPAACVYCNSAQHQSLECTKVLDRASRREFLKRNSLLYNCAHSFSVQVSWMWEVQQQTSHIYRRRTLKINTATTLSGRTSHPFRQVLWCK